MKKNNSIAGLTSIVLCFITVYTLKAQQDPQYTQYMYNHSNINPAYSGTTNNVDFFGLYRTQWVGLQGAPKTGVFSVNSPIKETGLGIGLHYMNDQIGVISDNNFALDLSYKIELSYQYNLSFGIKASGRLIDIDYSRLDIFNPEDPISQSNIDNKFDVNLGAGLFLYSDKSYIGISAPHFFSSPVKDINGYNIYKERTNWYLTGGYVFELSNDWLFKPAGLIKGVSGAPLQVDVTANFLYLEKLTMGVAYRWNASVAGLVGYQITDQLMIGYSYDTTTTKLSRYNSGSHEFFLKFTLFNRKTIYNAPRFF